MYATRPLMPFAPIPQILDVIRSGGMVVLVDDEDRENEGDLVMAAQLADAKSIAFMATKGCGLVCLAMDGPLLDRLGLPLMTRNNRSRLSTAFTLSIEAATGVTTGISAADRAHTILTAVSHQARPEDIISPGHIFPLRARDGGVLVRAGHTEASVDLSRLAGLTPAGVICEIMRPDGEMARLPDLELFCEQHGLLLATVASVIAYREERESLVECVATATLETANGSFTAFTYRSKVDGNHHIALVKGPALGPGKVAPHPILVRVQKEAVLSDVFGLHGLSSPHPYLQRIANQGEGVFLYMRDSHQNIPSHLIPLKESDQRPQQEAEVKMDPRDYGLGAQILHHLGVRQMRLMTSSDRHISALSGHRLEVVERIKI